MVAKRVTQKQMDKILFIWPKKESNFVKKTFSPAIFPGLVIVYPSLTEILCNVNNDTPIGEKCL